MFLKQRLRCPVHNSTERVEIALHQYCMKLCVQTHARRRATCKIWLKRVKENVGALCFHIWYLLGKVAPHCNTAFGINMLRGCCVPSCTPERKPWSRFSGQQRWPIGCGAGTEPTSGPFMGPDTSNEWRQSSPVWDLVFISSFA